jgi:hypothetical protein
MPYRSGANVHVIYARLMRRASTSCVTDASNSRRQAEPRDRGAELMTLMAEQPASLEELMAAMGSGGE